MNNTKSLNTKTRLGVCAAGLCMLVAQPCAAQSAVCVNLLVGAGYAAWMGVKFGESYYWSSSFPVGQVRCIKLPVSGMGAGAPYDVVAQAVLGSRVTCTPAPSTYAPNTNSVSYNAWGQVRNVHCEMPLPSGENAGANAAAVTPSKEGLEALEKWKKEGPQPHPQ